MDYAYQNLAFPIVTLAWYIHFLGMSEAALGF